MNLTDQAMADILEAETANWLTAKSALERLLGFKIPADVAKLAESAYKTGWADGGRWSANWINEHQRSIETQPEK